MISTSGTLVWMQSFGLENSECRLCQVFWYFAYISQFVPRLLWLNWQLPFPREREREKKIHLVFFRGVHKGEHSLRLICFLKLPLICSSFNTVNRDLINPPLTLLPALHSGRSLLWWAPPLPLNVGKQKPGQESGYHRLQQPWRPGVQCVDKGPFCGWHAWAASVLKGKGCLRSDLRLAEEKPDLQFHVTQHAHRA